MNLPKWWPSKDKWLICDVLEGLKQLPDNSVHCVVTSPPYFGLRNYLTATWEGGNNPDCDHKSAKEKSRYDYPMQNGSRHAELSETTQGTDAPHWKDICPNCGARKIDKQIGLENSPDEYVAKLTNVFMEVKRVLRDDGIVFLNLGDSYCGNREYATKSSNAKCGNTIIDCCAKTNKTGKGLKPKDLIGIPWRTAFALQGFATVGIDDIAEICKAIEERNMEKLDSIRANLKLWEELSGMNWYYNRMDIIWHKVNPMPESVTDRCTKAHEYIFMLTKNKNYFYDAESIKEVAEYGKDLGVLRSKTEGDKKVSWHTQTIETRKQNGIDSRTAGSGMRNKRSVWSFSSTPFKGSHFACFPSQLPEITIKCGTSQKGACPSCGKPWERVIEKTGISSADYMRDKDKTGFESEQGQKQNIRAPREAFERETKTLGWKPMCTCYGVAIISELPSRPSKQEKMPEYEQQISKWFTEWEQLKPIYEKLETTPCIVLDIFAGSGTTMEVAQSLNRIGLGIDLNPDYVQHMKKRVHKNTTGLDKFGIFENKENEQTVCKEETNNEEKWVF